MTAPRRVVLAIGQLHVGGTEGQLLLLAQGLKARGIKVAVASLFEGGPYEERLLEAGIPVYRGGFPPFLRQGLARSPAAIPPLVRYVRWFRELRPDTVHAFLYHAYVVTAVAARLARVPAVIAGRRSLGNFKEGRPLLLTAERVATLLTDRVVANSHAVARDVWRQEHLRAPKLSVIHNGIARSFFDDHAPTEVPHDHALVLCVANFRAYKGHRVLIEAARMLCAEGLRFTLALVGEGPERPRLEKRAADSGADVRFLGLRSDIPGLLAAADVVVLPSFEEGFSNTLLEAMATGRAIVATEVGGNAEALGGTGVLVAPNDPESLAEGLRSVLCDPLRANALGEAARRRAVDEFACDVMVDRHVELYRSLVA